MKTKSFIKKLNILAFCGSLFLIFSCRSEQQDTITEGTDGIAFNIDVSNFGETHTNEQANAKGVSGKGSSVSRQKFTSGPFSIISELSADPENLTRSAAISPRSFTGSNVKIRIVAYISATGEYADQLVTTVAGSKQKLFNLSGGKKYTFVTYSLNNTTDPPQAPAANLNDAKLNITNLDGKEAGTDILYAINPDVMLSGGNTTINVNLRHIFSRISISVYDDVSKGTPGQPGYTEGSYALDNNTTGFTGTILNNNTSFSLNLKDAIVSDGNNQTLSISGINTTAQNLIINTGGEANYKSKLIIPPGAVVIGNDSNSSPVSIVIDGPDNNGLQPGKSYTLKLKFNSDRYVDENGITQSKNNARYAVIRGYQWDRFNLGSSVNNPALSDPDIPSAEIHGAKYTYGAYTGQTGSYLSQSDDQNTLQVSGWGANGNYWNTQDPCEPGYRIPTQDEYTKLLGATSNTTVGTVNSYSYGRKLKSLRSEVQLVFPAAGFRSTGTQSGNITERGRRARYWNTSTLFDDTTAATSPHPSIGAAIRCIRKN
ncbi:MULTISPECIES: fimbrillin family protein [Elizabethkingia]|uniref:fimbrillin family protein n=1 Tax=Elizabethkingia TaxID=308865 RepID=UPI00209CD2B4|nr:fimbrillin family protein [Elizabethkingia sp. S0634]MCP1252720.1 fimbrillin family protein [Elizabethkingia sp. S0634]